MQIPDWSGIRIMTVILYKKITVTIKILDHPVFEWSSFQQNLCPNFNGKKQVPHSQCSLRKNPKFLQNFRSKNYTLIEKF
jgi:hypothetical protein